jgi:TP901 family phage tail tape measure protein
MAFETLGIGGILTFNDTQAVTAMTRTGRSFQRLQLRARRLSAGMSKIGAGIRSVGMASAAAGLGMGIGLKSAVDFEHQMASVSAVTGGVTSEMKLNSQYARKLGIDTAYSATEAGKAMFILGKFGLTKKPLRTATKGVTDLAAAVDLNMESAATVLIGTLKSMSMSTEHATRVSNVLAEMSVRTAARADGLGESFAYAGSTMKSMNVNVETSAAAFGLLADKMMIGSRAGTGMMALMRGLQGSSGKSQKLMKKWGINVQQFGGDMSKLPAILEHVNKVLSKKFTNPIKKAQAVTAIFGRFGQVAFNNLAQSGREKFEQLIKAAKKSGTKYKLFGKTVGAAAFMAAKRLDSVKGVMILIKSSLEGLAISMFKTFLGPMKARLNAAKQGFNNVLAAMTALGNDDSVRNQTKLTHQYGSTVVQVALGVRDGIKLVKDTWTSIGLVIKRVGMMFGQAMGKDTLRTIMKIVVGGTMLLGTMAPMFIALLGLKFLIGTVVSLVSGLAMVFSAVALPAVAVIAGIAAAFLLLREEGESVGATAMRIMTNVATFAQGIYQNAILPIFYGLKDIVMSLTTGMSAFWAETLGTMRGYVRELGDEFMMTSGRMVGGIRPVMSAIKGAVVKLKPFFKAYIKFNLAVLGLIIKVGIAAKRFGMEVASSLMSVVNALKPILKDIFGAMVKLFGTLFVLLGKVLTYIGQVTMKMVAMWGKVWNAIKPVIIGLLKMIAILYRVGKVISELVMAPFIAVYRVVKKLVLLTATKLMPVFQGIAGVLSTVFRFVLKIGKAIKDAILVPFKFVAGYMAKALGRLASVASYIPGLSKANILKLQAALQGFSGEGSMVVTAGPMGKVRRRRAERVAVTQTSRAEHLRQAKETQRMIDYRAKKAREARLQESIEKKTSVKVNTTTSIDGRCVADATARHRVEIQERAGYGMTPWQRRAVILRSNETTPQGAR